LERTARLLPARRRLRKALPALLFFTDPLRTPDIAAVARRLPRGSAIVLRAFVHDDKFPARTPFASYTRTTTAVHAVTAPCVVDGQPMSGTRTNTAM